MSELESSRHIAMWQYVPTGSVIHELDPRVKLAAGGLLIAAILAVATPLGAALALGAVFLALTLGRLPLGHALRRLRSAWAFFVMVALLQLLFFPHRQAVAGGGAALWQWGRLLISAPGLRLLAVLLLRLASLILLVSLLAFSTSPTELAHATERLLAPLQRLGLPAHELALILTLALRFLPLLGQEMERIMKAQVSRGADFGGPTWNVLARTRRMFPLLIPLFLVSLRRGEELIEAMESRCYRGGQGRTHLSRLQARGADLIALGIVVLLTAALLATNHWSI